MPVTTQDVQFTAPAPVLALAIELSLKEWKLAFATTMAEAPRRRTLQAATALTALPLEIQRAKRRLGLPADAPVVSCYEIGRDGFWVHHGLRALGIDSLVIDSSSIEVKRRARRAKSDGLDVASLVGLLLRHLRGDKKVWSLVRVPTPEQEDGRQLHRALDSVKEDRTRVTNRIKALLATQGVYRKLGRDFLTELPQIELADHRPLPPGLQVRLRLEWAQLTLLTAQIQELETERARQMATNGSDPTIQQVQQLKALRAIGESTAWLLVREGLGWRDFHNRREVGGFAGLVPTPHQSGQMARELGISKAGNERVRVLMIEIAWAWLRYQRGSALAQWYRARFAEAGQRARRIGIVALARKLLIALWRYLTTDVLPDGAILKPVTA
jgi:transposase